MPEVFLSASASPDGWPEKGRRIGGLKAEKTPDPEAGDGEG